LYQLFIDLLVKAIVNERGLFDRLRYLQKTLDSLDIEGIYMLDLVQQGQLLEPKLEDWKKTVELYLGRMKETGRMRNFVLFWLITLYEGLLSRTR